MSIKILLNLFFSIKIFLLALFMGNANSDTVQATIFSVRGGGNVTKATGTIYDSLTGKKIENSEKIVILENPVWNEESSCRGKVSVKINLDGPSLIESVMHAYGSGNRVMFEVKTPDEVNHEINPQGLSVNECLFLDLPCSFVESHCVAFSMNVVP